MTANVNVTKLLFKRGNTVQNANYTGINGEITVDTQAKTLRIHDGVTAGGNVITAGGVVGSYSNTNAAAYIPVDPTITSIQANVAAANAAISTITGIDTSLIANAATQQTQINLVNANVTAANAAITSLQSNAALQATSINSINANIGAYQIFANANAASQATSINSINANIGAYQIFANTNAASQATSINSINANLGAFQTYANTTFGTSNYGNTNVAAYLGAFNGNILPAANITYSLGSEQLQWRDLWVSNNTIYIGNTPIRVDGGNLLINNSPIVSGPASSLVNGAATFQLFANGESRSPDTIFASNGVSIINANGAIQGGIYNSGDADFFNIGASTGRGIKFYVNEETEGPLFFANGSVNVPNNLYSVSGTIGDVSMYGGTISGTNPNWDYLTVTAQIEGYAYVALPNDATASTGNLRIHNDAGNVELATGDGFNYNYWYFRNDGNLTIPGNINYANGVSILSGLGGAVTGNISVDTGAIQFVASSSGDGNGYATMRLIPDIDREFWDQYLIVDPTAPGHIHIRAGGTQDNSNADLILGGENSHVRVTAGSNPPVYIKANSASWMFGVDSSLSMPTGGNLYFDSSAVSVVDGMTSIRFADTTTQTTAWTGSVDFGNTIAIGYNTGTVSQGGGAVAIGSVAGNVSQGIGAVAVGEAAGTSSQGTEGIAIGKTAGEQSQGAYSIAIGSAAAYYQQRTGAIAIGTSAGALQQGNHAIAIGTGAGSALQGNNSIILNATGSALEQTTDNTFTVKPIRNASGSTVLYYDSTTGEITYDTAGAGSYGNTEVAAYLLTWPNVDVNILDTTSANITTLRATNFNSANAVISGGYISALTNASVITATVTTLNSTGGNITTLRATNFGTANAVITGGYINSLANLTATTAVFTNFSTGNAVINGGYISSLTNASITTSVVTNFSTANAVITGGYASGLANVTATGNVTAGNLIGYGSNTNIVAGAYTSTFDIAGNVILPNAYVSGNTTIIGIAPGYAPNRPAFRIYGSSSNNWTTANVNFKGSDIVVDYNQGSYFDSTTGVFTAPVAGLYSITLNARIGNNNGQNQIMVLKNAQTSAGNVAVMWECDTNTGTAVHYGVSSVMKLAAGDFLTANITVGTVQFDANDSWTVTYIG